MNPNDPLNKNKVTNPVNTDNSATAINADTSTTVPTTPTDIGVKKMSLSEFGATVKKKYPQYAGYPDEVIGQKTVERYPEYRDRIIPATPEDQANNNASYLGKVRSGFDYVANNVDKAVSGLATLYGGGEEGIATKLLRDVQAGASDIEKGNIVKGVAKSALRTAGDVARTVYAPAGAILEATGVNKFFEDIKKNIEAGKGLVGESVNFITDNPTIQEFAKNHPNAGEDFGRALTIALAATDTGKIEPSTALERTISQFNGSMNSLRNQFTRNVDNTGKNGDVVNTTISTDNLLKDGAKPTDIYSNPNMKVYQPNVAKQVVSDGYLNFKRYGLNNLGEQYLKSFGDYTNVTPDMVIQNGLQLLTPKSSVVGAIPKSSESSGFFKSLTQEIGDGFRSMIDSPNINPQIKSSAQRLQTTYKVDPVSTYDSFYKQEQQFKNDAKSDTALGIVGERTGQAFDKVIQQRRLAGQVIQEELSKVGGIKVDIKPAFEDLNTSITKEGLVYDTKTGSIRPTKNQTKMSTSDVDMLSLYANELGQLGPNPSISQIDGFLSRVSNDLNIYKNKNNITGTTNGERIIQANLAKVREQLSPEFNNNPVLSNYYNARKTYSDLTNFLDEGSSYLGQKTQTGDYARDASLSKSAVQSILNNGKKDWLLKLEDLTGYPALDESILAIQAMKDSGNFRANSLLETLTSGGIPTPSGIADKLFGWVAGKVGEVIKGSPYEQTKAFLQEQANNQGASAINANQNNGDSKTLNVISYKDNPDGTTTNFLSDGSVDVGRLVPVKGSKSEFEFKTIKEYPNKEAYLKENQNDQGDTAIDAISGLKNIGSNIAKGAEFVGGKIKDALMPEKAMAAGELTPQQKAERGLLIAEPDFTDPNPYNPEIPTRSEEYSISPYNPKDYGDAGNTMEFHSSYQTTDGGSKVVRQDIYANDKFLDTVSKPDRRRLEGGGLSYYTPAIIRIGTGKNSIQGDTATKVKVIGLRPKAQDGLYKGQLAVSEDGKSQKIVKYATDTTGGGRNIWIHSTDTGNLSEAEDAALYSYIIAPVYSTLQGKAYAAGNQARGNPSNTQQTILEEDLKKRTMSDMKDLHSELIWADNEVLDRGLKAYLKRKVYGRNPTESETLTWKSKLEGNYRDLRQKYGTNAEPKF